MVLDRAGWEVIPEVANDTPRMEAVPFKKGEGKGLYNHVGNFLSCIKSRELPHADVAIGARVAKMASILYALAVNPNYGRSKDKKSTNGNPLDQGIPFMISKDE